MARRQDGTAYPIARRLAVSWGLVAVAALPLACSAAATSAPPAGSSTNPVLREQALPSVAGAAGSKLPAQTPKTLVSLSARPDPTPLSCDVSWGSEPDPQVAIPRLAELARRRPSDARFHTCLANALFDAGRLPEAIGEYREAIRLNDALLEAYRNLAYALLDGGQRQAAVEVLARAVGLNPGDPTLRFALRRALRSMDHHP